MVHLGDVRNIDGGIAEPVDVIIGGSPCQDLSVAGEQKGFSGERSILFMDQIRIVREMREADEREGRTGLDVRPRFMVWENVPGAFSSNGGEDFRTVLQEIVRVKDKKVLVPRLPKGKWGEQGLSWETDFPSDGGYLTPNTGEYPSEENESHLSQILQEAAPDRYFLTAKACMGIIERAKRRGKELPPALREALEEQINFLQRKATENTP